MASYEEKLCEEARLWGGDAIEKAQSIPPDWRFHRALRDNVIMATDQIDALLDRVRPGMRTLELGCNAGWLTLAMAQRGAEATGMDISADAIAIARDYYESIRDTVSGSATYEVADLNRVTLPTETYDIICAKGTLHHLIQLDHVIDQIYQALKPGALLWVMDANGEETMPAVLIASAITFLLPTEVSYREKIGGLLRFGLRAPSRIKASMEAEGLSPFEGMGRSHDWLQLIEKHFTVKERFDHPAVTGYVTAQLKMPDRIAIPMLRWLYRLDAFFVRRGLLRGTGVTLLARKPESGE